MLLWQASLQKAPLVGAFFFASIISSHAGQDCSTKSYDEVARLQKVYDGDTIKLTDGRKVRLIAINTPEMGHAERPDQVYAQEARETLRSFFNKNRVVKLKFGRDKKDRYKRLLAHVFTGDGQNVAAELIQRGYGFTVAVPPNLWNSECYFSQEQVARQAGRGVWSHPNYFPKNPSEISRDNTGFQIIEGVITRIGKSKKSIWLNMGSQLALRVNRKDLGYFENTPILELEGRRVRVRGWVSFYNGKLRMSVKHPSMLKVLAQDSGMND